MLQQSYIHLSKRNLQEGLKFEQKAYKIDKRRKQQIDDIYREIDKLSYNYETPPF